MKILRLFTLICISVLSLTILNAQSSLINDEFQKEMARNNYSDIQLVPSSSTENKQIGITYNYYHLAYKGVKIEGLTAIFILDQEQNITKKYIPTLASQPQGFVLPEDLENELIPDAISQLDSRVQISSLSKLEFANKKLTFYHDNNEYLLKNDLYYCYRDQKLTPCIKYQLYQVDSYKSYEINYDLTTHDFFNLHPLYHECKMQGHPVAGCSEHNVVPQITSRENSISAAAYYTTKLPQESPLDGMALHPASPDFIASPYGWHDTDGEPGPDSENLSGNSVSVIIDRDGDETDDTIISSPDLLFDFVPDFTKDPFTYRSASATNQFYIVNQIHDILFNNGFDEQSNFQNTNYYGEGLGNDPVNVYVQFLADYNLKNNAFFAPTVDGEAPKMYFFLFDGGQNGKHIEILNPERHRGIHTASILVNGGSLRDTTITAEVILPEDAVPPYNDGCETYTSDVTDKIVIVPLSDCTPYIQALNAVNAGAAAILIAYDNELTIPSAMPNVSIPVLFIKNSTKLAIFDGISQGEEVEIKLFDEGETYADRDGSFENNIIAHEYAHGVSNRLIGGPNDITCMQNGEQMGEGWSDFYGYVLTMSPENYEDEVRYIGTYVLGAQATIRNKPYSSNPEINDYTYTDIKFTGGSPHNIGEIWGSMLWDLTQAFVERYGYQQDLISGNAGNRRVLNLVTEALKLTPCSPGFIDGRDAILQADELLYNGDNRCLIWETFAHRGLGYSAQQNDTYDATDGEEAYDLPPSCASGISVGKFMTESIKDGDSINVEIQIINKDGQSHIINFRDNVPENTTYINGSGSVQLELSNDVLSSSDDIMLRARDTLTISYMLLSEKGKSSVAIYRDSLDEESESDFLFTSVFPQDYSNMKYTTEDAATGDYCFKINHTQNEQELILELDKEINLDNSQLPFLKFSQKHDLVRNFEAVVVEVSTDGGTIWNSLEDDMLKNGYQDKVSPFTFFYGERRGYTGFIDDWYTTYIDLSDYAGEDIRLRWKVGTAGGDNYSQSEGWFIDDIGIWDRYNITSELCVTYDGEESCVYGEEYGTIVFSDQTVSTTEPTIIRPQISIYPNPSQNQFRLNSDEAITHYKLINIDGQIIKEQDLGNIMGYDISTTDMSSGMYILQLTINGKYYFDKVIIKK